MKTEVLKPNITLIGFQVGEYLVDACLADGPFSSIFSAASSSGETVAIKIAKLKDDHINSELSGHFSTRAFYQQIGYFRKTEPDRMSLLQRQAEFLIEAKGTAFIDVVHYDAEPLAQYFMPLIEHKTLREHIQNRKVAHQVLLNICLSMIEIENHDKLKGHHDLKPENILVGEDGHITLIDPGYFGPMRSEDGGEHSVMVTTPEYYPYLQPSDTLAFAYILWECIAGIHPLIHPIYVRPAPNIGENLERSLSECGLVGNYNLEPLRTLWLPKIGNSDLNEEEQNFLLKAIGLQLTDENTIDSIPRYATFAELYEELTALDAPEIWENEIWPTHLGVAKTYQVEPDDIFGIKGLASRGKDWTNSAPYKFGFARIFERLELNSETPLKTFAGYTRNGKIDVVIMREKVDEYAESYELISLIDKASSGVYALLSLHGPDKKGNIDTYAVVRAEAESGVYTISEQELAEITPVVVQQLQDGTVQIDDKDLLEKAFGYLEPYDD